ncbi:MAG: hypothetical protein K2X87_26660 [Gemmataceae bacterium]|nr:hypothetical protein [Gemmataceae bacterium]
MSADRRYGRAETPMHVFPVQEPAFTGAGPEPGVTYGRTEAPVRRHEPVDLDFAVPYLVLTLRMPDDAGAVDPDVLGVDIYHLMTALSDYEKTIGGRGLRLHEKAVDGPAVTLTLAPVLVENARERVSRVADLLAEAGRSRDPSGSLAEALDRAASSPAERFRTEVARRGWRIGVSIAA